jgi:hypothetical protein
MKRRDAHILLQVLLYMPRDNWRSYLTALRDVPVLTKTEINVFICAWPHK